MLTLGTLCLIFASMGYLLQGFLGFMERLENYDPDWRDNEQA